MSPNCLLKHECGMQHLRGFKQDTYRTRGEREDK